MKKKLRKSEKPVMVLRLKDGDYDQRPGSKHICHIRRSFREFESENQT